MIDWFCPFPRKLPHGYNSRVNAKSDSTQRDNTVPWSCTATDWWRCWERCSSWRKKDTTGSANDGWRSSCRPSVHGTVMTKPRKAARRVPASAPPANNTRVFNQIRPRIRSENAEKECSTRFITPKHVKMLSIAVGCLSSVNQTINWEIYNESLRLIDWLNPPSEKLPHGDDFRVDLKREGTPRNKTVNYGSASYVYSALLNNVSV